MSSENEIQYSNSNEGSEKINCFQQWLSENGVDTSNFCICENERKGKFLVASRDIQDEENFLSLPQSILFGKETALVSVIGPIIRNVPDLPQDEVLALHLMVERKNEESFWRPYLDILPQHFETPIFWSQEEIDSLTGSMLSHLVSALNRRIEQDFESTFHSLFDSYQDIFGDFRFSLEDYKWALSVVWSRAIGLTRGGKYQRVLCPMLDLANHHHSATPIEDAIQVHEIHEEDDEKSIALSWVCKRSIKSGDQIQLKYGNYSNAKLLYTYGFVEDDNPIVKLDLWPSLQHNDPHYDFKARVLEAHEAQTTFDFSGSLTGIFIVGDNQEEKEEKDISGERKALQLSLSRKLLGMTRVLFLTPEEFPNASAAFRGRIVSLRNESAVYMALKSLCENKLKRYSHLQSEPNESTNERILAGVRVCTEEYQLLQYTIVALQTWLRQLVENPGCYIPPDGRESAISVTFDSCDDITEKN